MSGRAGRARRPAANKHEKVWIGGLHSVAAALRGAPGGVDELRFAPGRRERRLAELLRLAAARGAPRRAAHEDELARLAGERHQGVAARCALPSALGDDALLELCRAAPLPSLLLLDCVTDPHNFGACLRTAEACGVTAVVVPARRAVGLTPAVARASAGAVFRVRVARAANLARTMGRLREEGVWIAGAAADAEESLYNLDCRRPLAFALGAEGEGLRRLTRGLCDHLVSIPMAPGADSLNVSVAAAVCLYEMRRQRRA